MRSYWRQSQMEPSLTCFCQAFQPRIKDRVSRLKIWPTTVQSRSKITIGAGKPKHLSRGEIKKLASKSLISPLLAVLEPLLLTLRFPAKRRQAIGSRMHWIVQGVRIPSEYAHRTLKLPSTCNRILLQAFLQAQVLSNSLRAPVSIKVSLMGTLAAHL